MKGMKLERNEIVERSFAINQKVVFCCFLFFPKNHGELVEYLS